MSLHVVLYSPEIPQNTGNIMRTCAATNAKLHLIKPLGFSLDEKYIKRSSANNIEKIDYEIYENWDDFTSKNKGDYIFLTRYAKEPPSKHDFSIMDKEYYLIFGRESTGIPKEILQQHLDTSYRLPMKEDVRSLNLSNVVAIMVYEALRQRDYQGLSRVEVIKGENFIYE
jgi:tRNA (cytidine/uridine-2'-O-)-methyltransferase